MEKTKQEKVVEPKVVQQVEKPKKVSTTKKIKPVYKDKLYNLSTNMKPIAFKIKSRGIMWFDEEKGYEREIKYCENQKTVFVDEMEGPQRLAHITFRDGILYVPKEKQTLQKFLAIHPDNGRYFVEEDLVKEAEDDLDYLHLEVTALNTAMDLDIDIAEAILRAEVGSKVSQMTSKELKRDLLVFARSNPALFLELAHDDNLNIRNIGIKAVENGIIKLSNDQRTFVWGANDRKLMTVPFDENPYSALAAWFKTDEGIEVYKSVEKKLK
jgi:hypothetical protein|tara:strand:+ start:5469 stop:6275 length:807 start_codon:yes stop_codon:yes gene_type:complete